MPRGDTGDSVGDAVTALEDAIKCLQAAMRALEGAELTGMLSVKKNGIMVVTRSVIRRLSSLREEARDEADGG